MCKSYENTKSWESLPDETLCCMVSQGNREAEEIQRRVRDELEGRRQPVWYA